MNQRVKMISEIVYTAICLVIGFIVGMLFNIGSESPPGSYVVSANNGENVHCYVEGKKDAPGVVFNASGTKEWHRCKKDFWCLSFDDSNKILVTDGLKFWWDEK